METGVLSSPTFYCCSSPLNKPSGWLPKRKEVCCAGTRSPFPAIHFDLCVFALDPFLNVFLRQVLHSLSSGHWPQSSVRQPVSAAS